MRCCRDTGGSLMVVSQFTPRQGHDVCRGRCGEEQVVSLALLARSCGMGGVVASPREAAAIRGAAGEGLVKAGADYLVIGRPILRADDPVGAALRVAEELA